MHLGLYPSFYMHSADILRVLPIVIFSVRIISDNYWYIVSAPKREVRSSDISLVYQLKQIT